ncbi:MAG: DUF3488 and transglutaminase-like domain-containing protein [Azonexus sp.]|jgi:transglutaminase-like putative cysteine protease|uniref:transglutaminase TgpA family protein n=1 Tax=Azonexus sp. TaxID=1872668 RepID=UPI00281CC621|nr:DUF3488 and transglutaminase-like domain-containing protein [Azonexus sp.]MDR0775022.1 DUF3488 and transglutaminase-like domain-containing protein [Azonexus sp.]
MSTPAKEALDHSATPWLFLAAVATVAPHFAHQPSWLSVCVALTFAWGGWLWWQDRRLPGRWLLVLLVAGGCAAILAEFHTLFGRDPGVALLVMLMALKLLELKSRRDAIVVVILGYFLLLTHYFYSQSIPTGLWLLTALWLVTATLIRVHGGSAATTRGTLRHAAVLAAQSLPFMLVLYLLFPRIPGPLWGLPQDAHAGRTGLSETMTPGNIASLAQSSEIAFRVLFDGALPPRDKLYWRGPVLEAFDGRIWRPYPGVTPHPQLALLSQPVDYQTTLEGHSQRWLLALDAPSTLPADAILSGTLTVNARQPVVNRQRHRFSSVLDYRFNVEETQAVLQRNLALPGNNPRSVDLARRWRAENSSPQALIDKALDLFAREFFYTLRPPLLGENGIDEFLFTTRRGFCEHFAAAFVVLMRAGGVPARVVTGYQGGERNPVDGFLVVRQSDAHAWAEVWLAGRGWVRVDPTAAVSPSRIEAGIADALPAGEPLPALLQVRTDWLRTLRHRWEAINNAWNQQVIGFDRERQRDLLARFGLPDADWRDLAIALGTATALLLTASLAWALYHRPHRDPAARLWQKVLRYLARRQVHCAPWETPLALAVRLKAERPELAEPVAQVVEAYLLARYGTACDLKMLRAAIARLP